MTLRLEKFENYFVLNLSEHCDSAELQLLWDKNQAQILYLPYLIVLNHSSQSVSNAFIQILGEIQKTLLEHNGLMLCVNFNAMDLTMLEEAEIATIPSFDEAVDYIFIDQLEKELGEE